MGRRAPRARTGRPRGCQCARHRGRHGGVPGARATELALRGWVVCRARATDLRRAAAQATVESCRYGSSIFKFRVTSQSSSGSVREDKCIKIPKYHIVIVPA